MAFLRKYAFALAALAAPVLPVSGVFLYQTVVGNSVYQPLGVTRERLAAADPSYARSTVRVKLEWGSDLADEVDIKAFSGQIEKAISARTANFTMKVLKVPGRRIQTTISIAGTELGPFPPARVARGIQEAMALQQMALYPKNQ